MAPTISRKPRKQRKAQLEAPAHILSKLMSAHLSDELREKYNRRSLPVRVGDTVKVLRGDYKKVEGKVIRVDRKRRLVYIDGITRKKVDGSTVNVPVHVSNVMITQLNLDDEYRRTLLEKGREGLTEWKRGY